MPIYDLAAIFKACKDVVGKDPTKPAFHTIRLQHTGEKCNVYASDAYRIRNMEIFCPGEPGTMQIPIIPLPAKNAVNYNDMVNIEDRGDKIFFGFPHMDQIFDKPEGSDVPFEQHFKRDDVPVVTIHFDKRLLADLLKSFDEKVVELSLYGDKAPCIIKSESNGQGFILPLNPRR